MWNAEPNMVDPLPGTKKKLKSVNFKTWANSDNKVNWTQMMAETDVGKIIDAAEVKTRNMSLPFRLSSQYAYILDQFDKIFAKGFVPDKDETKYHVYRIALAQDPPPTPTAFAIGILSTMQEYAMQHRIEDKTDLYALTAYRGARGLSRI